MLGTGFCATNTTLNSEPTILQANTPLTGASRWANAVNLAGALAFAGTSPLQLSGPITLSAAPI